MTDERAETVKVETVKWLGSVLLAAVVSYLGTTYGMQARIDLLEARVKASEASASQLDALTDQVAALNQKLAVASAVLERVEARLNGRGR